MVVRMVSVTFVALTSGDVQNFNKVAYEAYLDLKEIEAIVR